MIAPAHSAAAEVAAQMPHTADHEHADPAPEAEAAAGVAWRAWRQFGENPLQALFGAAIVALLVFSFTTTNDRIDDTNKRIDDTNDRITRLEARMDARFTVLEEGVAENQPQADRPDRLPQPDRRGERGLGGQDHRQGPGPPPRRRRTGLGRRADFHR